MSNPDYSMFRSYANENKPADFSGSIYINNIGETQIDEAYIASDLLNAYPNLKVFAANIKSAYSAQFVMLKEDGSYQKVPDITGDDTKDSIQAISQQDFAAGIATTFTNPYELYDPSEMKAHYDA